MIHSFLLTAFRHLLKNRIYAGLNILGLSVGLACFAIIGMWVKQQLSFDTMHEKANRIYQVNAKVSDETGMFNQAITPAGLAPAIINDLPEIDQALRLDMSGATVKYGKQQFIEEGIIGADPSFFNLFDFRLLEGNPSTALSEPYTVVISQRIAKKYFGDRNPINESLRIFIYDPDGSGAEYKITGIIEDCPADSHFSYSMIISFKTIEVAEPESLAKAGWSNNEYYTYLLLKPMASASSLEAKFPILLKKYQGNQMSRENVSYRYFLTSLSDIHFRTDVTHQIQAGVSMTYIMVLSSIGMIVLILACINYISLSTAYSVDQFTEVGIRKVLGASERQVVLQYLVESWLLSVMAMAASLVWIELSRPLFENIFGQEMIGLYTFSSLFTLLGVASMAGVLSGIYPSLILSSFSPIEIVKGQLSRVTGGTFMRKALVVLQYSITIVLVTGILVVTRQLNYIKDKDLGFQRENLLLLATNGSPEVIPGYQAFANEVLSHASISGIARSNTGIGGGGLDRSKGSAEIVDGRHVGINIHTVGVDHRYISTYKMLLVAGRNFIPGNASDSSSAYILNEAAVRAYGYDNPKDAIGKFFSLEGKDGQVVGVVRDFHYATMREKIEPAVLFLLNGYFSRVTVRMNDDATKNTILLADIWRKHFPASVVDFSFLEDRLQNSYRSEDRFSKTFLIFSIISVIIASLGLFALVSYNVERRSKEIGIRKVLGGTATEISTMLSKEFLFLVLIACVVAMPISWYIMDKWLQNFAYHIPVGANVFIIAAIVNIAIAMGTVGLKTVRSALRNPVDSLRSE